MNTEELLELLCNSFWEKLQNDETYTEAIKQVNWTKAPDNPAKGIIIVEYTNGEFDFFIIDVHHGAIVAD